MSSTALRLASCIVALSMMTGQALAGDVVIDDQSDAARAKQIRNAWRSELQRMGFYHPKLPRAYRIGVPVFQFGDNGPKLMVGYTPRLQPIDGRKVFLVYATFELD